MILICCLTIICLLLQIIIVCSFDIAMMYLWHIEDEVEQAAELVEMDFKQYADVTVVTEQTVFKLFLQFRAGLL